MFIATKYPFVHHVAYSFPDRMRWSGMRTAAHVGSGLRDKVDKVRQGVVDMQLVCKTSESGRYTGARLN